MEDKQDVSNSDFEKCLRTFEEVGYVTGAWSGVCHVEGLPTIRLGELIYVETGQIGEVTKLMEGEVEVLLLSRKEVRVGDRVARSGRLLQIFVGSWLLGKVIDPVGRQVLSVFPMPKEGEWRNIDSVPVGIVARRKIESQLNTGVTMVDLMVPLGKGQRELIMGDRKTGKTHVLWQIILSHARAGGVCVYAAIGKKKTEIAKVDEFIESHGLSESTVVVAASSEDVAGQIFTCPYTAMTVAEYFRDLGREVLVVMDDMSAHAKFYRELSLLSRKFPGRDSYPGDIFHVHSKLMERAGNFLISGNKTASITCLPVVETMQGDVTGYIQTNLMSMTDGHIYFDNDLFFRGRRPAINPFISVTRVGHQTQTPLGRDAGRVLYDLMGSYEKTQGFVRFGAELGENSRQVLAMGDKLLKFFDQPGYSILTADLELLLLAMLLSGAWDGKDIQKLASEYETKSEVNKAVHELIGTSNNMSELIEKVRLTASKLFKL